MVASNETPPSASNEIGMFFHCGKCLLGKPGDVTPKDYQQISVGYTPVGLQVWCDRCECNIIHLDFGGQKFLANTHAHD